MHHKADGIAGGTGGKGHDPVLVRGNDPRILHGAGKHLIDQRLVLLVGRIPDGIDLAVIRHILIRENLIPESALLRVNGKILVGVIEILVPVVLFQRAEHAAVLHVMTIQDVVIV